MAWRAGQAYSSDLRGRVLAAVDGGTAVGSVATLFSVSVSYIHKALGRRRKTGETEARPQRNHQELKLAQHHDVIAAEVRRRPDGNLEELRAWLLAEHALEVSLGLMHDTLVRLGLTLKKNPAGRRSRTAPTSPCSGPPGSRRRAS